MKKKVLFCTSGRIGGAARMTINISKLLDPAAFDVKYVVVDKKLEEIKSFFPEDSEYIFMQVRNSWDFLFLRFLKIIKQEKPDIFFSSYPHMSVRLILACRLAGVSSIIRSCNHWSTFAFRVRLMMQLTYPLADKVIMQQQEMYDEFLKAIPQCKKNMLILHNLLDNKLIGVNIKEKNPYCDNQEIRYVWAGRITFEKGYDVLLSAFSLLKNQIPNAHLYLLGKIVETSKYYQSLVEYVRINKMEDCVHFLGMQVNPHKWIAHADCFVLPSRREGLPNALVEAMYIGVPVVAVRCIPIIDRMVLDGYNGYVVPVNEPKLMAEAMKKALALKHFNMVYKPSSEEDFRSLFCDK